MKNSIKVHLPSLIDILAKLEEEGAQWVQISVISKKGEDMLGIFILDTEELTKEQAEKENTQQNTQKKGEGKLSEGDLNQLIWL